MSSTPLTPAQAAQQNNRDGGGRYAEKQQADPGDVGLTEDRSWNAIADIDGATREQYLAALPAVGDRVWVHFDDANLGEPDEEATVIEVDPEYGDAPEYRVRFDSFDQWGGRKHFRVMPWELYPIQAERADRFSDRALAEAERIFDQADIKPGVSYEDYMAADGRVALIRTRRIADLVHSVEPDAKYIRLVDANDEVGRRALCFEDVQLADGTRATCNPVYGQIRDEMVGLERHCREHWLPLCTSSEPASSWDLDIDKALAISGADLDRGSVQ